MPADLGPAFVAFSGDHFGGGGPLLQLSAPALFYSLPLATCLILPFAWAPYLALLVGIAALLPRLLWQPTQPAEGPLFTLANALYWNLAYPALFGSPLLLVLCSVLRPYPFLPLAGAWLVYSRVVSRPELGAGLPWKNFACHDWGIVALRRYLRLRVHVSTALHEREASRPVVIGIHPHGVAADYRVAMDGLLYPALKGRPVYTLAASVLFALPLVREIVLWTRAIDASKKCAARALKRGLSLAVIPGGEAEQMRTRTGIEEVFLSKRAGFVKLAMQHGAALVPCYAFGTCDLYDVSAAQHAANSKGLLWMLSKKFGVALPRYNGSFGFVPKRVPNDLVFGAPIEPACASPGAPTVAEVEAAHAAYIAALKQLFDTHKSALGFGDRELLVT